MRLFILIVTAFVTVLVAAPAPAQFGDILRDVRNVARDARDAVVAVRSLTTVTFGESRPANAPAASNGPNASGAGAALDSGSEVFLYSTSWCKYCDRAREHMQARQIQFVEKDIESSPNNRAEYDQLRSRGIPVLLFGTKTMSGFSTSAFDKMYGEFQTRLSGSADPSTDTAGSPGTAQTGLAAGTALTSKLAEIKVHSDASRAAQVVGTVARSQTIVYLGEERDGFLKVATDVGDGWVDRLLVK
jgi:glutaredoxin